MVEERRNVFIYKWQHSQILHFSTVNLNNKVMNKRININEEVWIFKTN